MLDLVFLIHPHQINGNSPRTSTIETGEKLLLLLHWASHSIEAEALEKNGQNHQQTTLSGHH
jgi:hypothetical protein